MVKKRPIKKAARKSSTEQIYSDASSWAVRAGELTGPPGRPPKVKSLFEVVAEKLPCEALDAVRKDMRSEGRGRYGVYIAHDSMGYARYVGRGDVFSRLKARFKAHPLELAYFSFYIVAGKQHEREIETLLIRAGGPHLHFNAKKRRVDIEAGDVRDFEVGTCFYERQRRRGRPAEIAT